MKVTQRRARDFAQAVGLNIRKDAWGNWFLVKTSEHLTPIEFTTEDLLDAVCAYAGGHPDYVVASLEFEGKE